jgi:preprotein translocase subunit SecY
MLKTLQNAWKVQDLRRKILITLALLAVYRFGIFIPVPFINAAALEQILGNGMLFGFLDLISGGAFRNFSIFAMGVTPYINSSIIMSLLTIAIPKLEALSKEGEEGRKKIAEYTRYGTIIFALIEAFSISMYLRNNNALINNSWFNMIVIIITVTAGTVFVMWLGEKITESGLGNGTSLIIFAGILARFPSLVYQVYAVVKGGSANIINVVLLAAGFFILIVGIVAMDLGERRIPVQYAQKRVGMRSFGGQSSHIPINVNPAGVIAIIFAMSVMQFPLVITQLFMNPGSGARQVFESGFLSQKGWLYPIIYVVFVIFFTWFYTSVTFKPDEVASNLQKSGGFVPCLRPGKPTEEYITRIMNRMTVIGGIFASLIAVAPIIVANYTPFGNLAFGGTAVLIMVGVALEINKQLQAQLAMRHYEGFLK